MYLMTLSNVNDTNDELRFDLMRKEEKIVQSVGNSNGIESHHSHRTCRINVSVIMIKG
jgi:hypothetical protein